MKGLLYKDCVTLAKQMKFFLAMVILFAILPIPSLTGFALVYAAMLPYSAMAYDESSKWNRLAVMLPYSDGQLVLSKYILGWLSIGAVLILSCAARAVVCIIRGAQYELGPMLLSQLLCAAVALLLMAISLPLLLRFGVEKGRTALIFSVVFATVGGSLSGAHVLPDLSCAPEKITAAALALAGLANAASAVLSRRLFRRHMLS